MANWKNILEIAVGTTKTLAKDKNVVSFLCGTYSDGTPRNISDAINGEFLSPKQKKKLAKKKKKKKQAKFKL